MNWKPVEDATAWRGTELSPDGSWVSRLDGHEVAEIDAALKAVTRRGLRPGEFGRDDFPLDRLARRLEQVLDELEGGRGFMLLRGLPVAHYDEAELLRIYWGLGTWLGEAQPQRAVLNLSGVHNDLIAHVTDQGYDIRGRNVHGSATRAEQSPHVDPADVVALLCVRPAKRGGLSRIASATTIYNEILRKHPQYLDALGRGFRLDLRGEVREGVDAKVTPERVPVYSECQGRLSVNFNARMIRTGHEKLEQPLTSLEAAAVEQVETLARDPSIRLDMDFRPGDIQLLNNYTILHYRSAWEDHDEPQRRRLLYRLWLNVANARPLAPDFHGGAQAVARHDIFRRALASH